MTKNQKRAMTVAKAIRHQYHNHTSKLVPEDVIDILADIRHLCDARGWSFADQDRVAYQHYSQERTNDIRGLLEKRAS